MLIFMFYSFTINYQKSCPRIRTVAGEGKTTGWLLDNMKVSGGKKVAAQSIAADKVHRIPRASATRMNVAARLHVFSDGE